MVTQSISRFSVTLSCLLLLSACGGSGSSDADKGTPVSFSITATSSTGGSISPSNATITAGQSFSFTLTAREGYELSSVTGCGGTLSGNTYQTGPINHACTVTARFDKISYTVTKVVYRNDQTESTQFSIEHGQSFTLPIEVLTWYSVELDSSCQGQQDTNGYTISSVVQSCAIKLDYQLDYLPAAMQPALGLPQDFYELNAGETLSVPLLAQSFTSAELSYQVQQLSGPEASFSQNAANLDLTAPVVDTMVDLTFRVAVTDEHDAQTNIDFTLRVHPLISSEVRLLKGVSNGVGVDLVITGDGFTAEQQGALRHEADQLLLTLFKEPTIAAHKDFWNVHFAPAVSAESGAVHGHAGHTTLDTAFNSYFNCADIDRLLCTDISKLLNFTIQHVPQYDQILLMVNDTKYGGAGYWGAAVGTFSLAPHAKEIAIHELGHSFAALADEYEYGNCWNDGEFSEANVTIESNPAKTKWKHWYNDLNNIPTDPIATSNQVVGHFQGGRYCEHGVWRPTSNSVMRSNGMPFGPVNAEQWALSIYRDAGLLRGHYPLSNEINISPTQSTVFSVVPFAGPEVQRVRWFYNGEELAESLVSGHALFVPPQERNFVIEAIIDDVSGLIKQDPEQISSTTIEWRGKISALGDE